MGLMRRINEDSVTREEGKAESSNNKIEEIEASVDSKELHEEVINGVEQNEESNVSYFKQVDSDDSPCDNKLSEKISEENQQNNIEKLDIKVPDDISVPSMEFPLEYSQEAD